MRHSLENLPAQAVENPFLSSSAWISDLYLQFF